MITQFSRIAYWKTISEGNISVAHNAAIMDGATITGVRKSFLYNMADEVPASEMTKLEFPAVVAHIVEGRIILRDDQRRMRYNNQLSFLNRFSVVGDNNPCIPESKLLASDIAYEVMMQYIKKLLDDYELSGSCGYFQFIDESSIRWEAIDTTGANMTGWNLYFNDEERKPFDLNTTEPLPWPFDSTPERPNATGIFYFGTETEITIPWTDELKAKFGAFPMFQVWTFETGRSKMINVVATADGTPEDTTFFTIQTPATPGFIVTK